MTSKERVLAAIRREPVDHVPCAPFMNLQGWNQRLGKRWQYPFGPSVHETMAYMVGILEVDQVVGMTWTCFPGPGVTTEVWQDGDILHKNIQTPSGKLHAAVRLTDHWPHGFDIPLFDDYMPAHAVEQWVKRREDVECLRHILMPPRAKRDLDGVRFHFQEMKRLADKFSLATIFNFGLGLTGAVQMFGPTELCLKAVEEPDLVDAYLEIDHQWNLRNFEIAFNLGVDVIRRNGFYESCDLFSPPMLDKFLSRRLREEILFVHNAGKPIVYTLLSGITPMLDHLSKLDFDGLVCPDVFLKNEDVAAMRNKLGQRMSFWTGPSDTLHMPVDMPDDVRKAVQYVFNAFGRTGLLITPCSSSKAVFPWTNVLAMIEEWKKLR
ncbi:MAG: hypothetical protein HY360_16395 [Verrucomicrobia bacterium]|nr:hypothetical protein [Verrucomicrobiota bacterium]